MIFMPHFFTIAVIYTIVRYIGLHCDMILVIEEIVEKLSNLLIVWLKKINHIVISSTYLKNFVLNV